MTASLTLISSTSVLTPIISPSAYFKAEGRALCCCRGDGEHTEHGPQRAEDSCLTPTVGDGRLR